MRKKLSKLVTIVGAMACLAVVPVVSAEAYTQEELLYSEDNFTKEEKADYISKYGDTSYITPGSKFGKIPESINDSKITLENDRTGGINIRWTEFPYSVAIERYDYATKQWEFIAYKSKVETSVANKVYAIDEIIGAEKNKRIMADRTANNYYLYEDDAAQINKTYKYRITPYIIYSQSRAEAIALGKEAEYTKVITDYVAKGCQVVEENGYTVVFYPSQETKKVKNTLEAPYMSAKETLCCTKCKRNLNVNSTKCPKHSKSKLKKQFTFDIEWQDVDGYEIYYSTYSDTGFKKLKTIKPGKIAASFTVYPTSAYESETHISTAFQHHVKQSYKKYFFKVRSFVNVNGKKVYSDFSPVASNYDYVLHYRYLDEVEWFAERGELASIQATQEYNQLNRLMNERAYLWEKYPTGKISKTKLIGCNKYNNKKSKVFTAGNEKYITITNTGIYTKKVKSITMGNSGRIIGDIDAAIRKANKGKPNVDVLSINISYTKSNKAYVIRVVYQATEIKAVQ